MTSDARRYLGVDGGGTRTSFCLISAGGEVLGASEQPTTSYFRSEEGIALVGRILEQGIAAVTGERDAVDFAFFALPGYGEVSSDVAALDAAPRAVLGHDRYACDNDMVAGWAGSLAGSDGINVVAGTGSIAYGEHDGRRGRAGGWGELFGDEGSGYWIGLRGLNLFTRMSDGRLPRGPLHDLILEYAGITREFDLIEVVVSGWGRGRTEIAALSPVVARAAEAGDGAAADTLREAATHLVDLVEATRRGLGFTSGETVPVSYSGGVFNADGVRETFAATLQHLPHGYDLRTPRFEPVVGAALYAARTAGSPLVPAALRRLGGAGPAA
jgi:N-acetylglucosamine kinase-like BadF-type ATPase